MPAMVVSLGCVVLGRDERMDLFSEGERGG
jgi:hypothetical protein